MASVSSILKFARKFQTALASGEAEALNCVHPSQFQGLVVRKLHG
jgi:hypothetical protein